MRMLNNLHVCSVVVVLNRLWLLLLRKKMVRNNGMHRIKHNNFKYKYHLVGEGGDGDGGENGDRDGDGDGDGDGEGNGDGDVGDS